jgi:3-oxoacyl-[acyl-carrier protein] reductase
MSKNYSEINIGDKAEVIHEISSKDIQDFATLTGDDNRLHLDPDYAKNTSFKKPVAHGMLGASFISTVIGTKLPGDGALWFSQNLEFLLPVRVGDTIKVIAEVINKNDREEIIELSTDIFNQHKQKVTTGRAKVKIVSQEEEEYLATKEIDEQKVALVLGASGGIGFETTKQLLSENFKVIAHYRTNGSKLANIGSELESPDQLLMIKADLNTTEGLEEVIEKVNRYTPHLDSLIYAASPAIPNIDFQSLDWTDFQKQIHLHVEVPFHLIQKLESHLSNRNSGVVLITTQSIEQPFSKLTHYTVAKGALYGLSKALATDLSSKKIRVNAVSPSIADTDLNADLPQKVKLLAAAKTPLKRLAEAKDIAQAIVFLADASRSSFITGETIRINGGQIMW